MKYCFGVDIGGTSIKMGLFTLEGELIEKLEIPTNLVSSGSCILTDIAHSIKEWMSKREIKTADVVGIGVGVPGPVQDNGLVLKCVNLGWDVLNIKDELETLTGLRVVAGNDANVAALGELFKGGGSGAHSMVMVTMGTGVGGGIIIDGKIVSGANGSGGEIGHFPMMDEEEEFCGCGKKGCLEQYASATGIVRLAKHMLLSEKASDFTSKSLLNAEALTAETIVNAAKAGDYIGLAVVDRIGWMLGRALAMLACTVNPEVFVIGGGVSKAGDFLLDAIQRHFEIMAFHGTKNTQFAIARLGNDAGIYGGAKLILDEEIA